MNKNFLIEFKDGQGIGNQLWSYASAVGIASKYNLKFGIIGKNSFKAPDFIFLKSEYDISNILVNDNYDIAPEKLLSSDFFQNYEKKDKVFLLDSPLQNYEYLQGSENIIKSSFDVKLFPGTESLDNFALIQVRGGDYFDSDSLLPKTYYQKSLDYLSFNFPELSTFAITDDIQFSQYVLPQVEIIGGVLSRDPSKKTAQHHTASNFWLDFSLLMQSTVNVISSSTFSWWPSWLSEKKRAVVGPKYWFNYGKKVNRTWRPSNLSSVDAKWVWIS